MLLVAILHVTFNATNNTQLLAAAAWALALVIITRGRLGLREESRLETTAKLSTTLTK